MAPLPAMRAGRPSGDPGRPLPPALILAAALFLVASVLPPASAFGVLCGDERAICPAQSPICCGPAGDRFCIAAGYKCCPNVFGRGAVACAQGEECCQGYYGSQCCRGATSCMTSASGIASCVPDVCAAHRTQEACVANPSDKCGWCCEEHRCSSLQVRPRVSSLSTCPSQPLVLPGQRCASRCFEANTCAVCTGTGDVGASDEAEESCAWCCATMTCMPAHATDSQCPNRQYTESRDKCVGCYTGGAGVGDHVNDDIMYYSLATLTVLIFGIVSAIVCGRVLMSILCARVSLTVAQVQQSVKRYGFAATDARPSSPITHHGHRRPLETEVEAPRLTTAEGSVAVLAAEDRTPAPGAPPVTREGRGEGEGEQLFPSTAVPEPQSEAVAVSSTCAACRAVLRLSELESRLSSVAPPAEGTEAVLTDASASAPPPERKDDPAVIFLPCGHCCCYRCVGIPPNTPAHRPAAPPPPPPPPPTAADSPAPANPPATAAPPASTAEPTIEELIQKKRKGKCPACKKKFTDLLVTEKVRNL